MVVLRVLAAGAMVAAAIVTGAVAQSSGPSDKQFQAALQKEMVAGDLTGAIEEYRRISARPSVSRALAAEALLRMAECYEKLGDPEARKVHERILAEFSTEAEIAGRARARLALQSPPAAPRAFDPVPADSRLAMFWTPSPDGRYAMAVPAGAEDPGLVLHDLVTGTHRLLVKSESQQSRVRSFEVWSPDGRRGIYVWRRTALPPTGRGQSIEIRIIDIATGASQPLAPRPEGSAGAVRVHAWTTRGEIVFTVGQREVFFMPVGGGTSTRLTLPESSQFGDITPDGSVLLLTRAERLTRLDRASGEERTLTQGFEVAMPRISTDGKLVAFFAKQSASWSLRVAPLTQSPIARSIEIAAVPPADAIGNRFLRWSRDGRLALDGRVTADSIYGIRLEGGRAPSNARLARLVHDSWSAGNPKISPDDRVVAYATGQGLAIMNVDGSGERELVEGGYPVGWLSHDEVVFSRSVDEGLSAVSIRTGTIRSIGHDAPVNANVGTGAQRDNFQYSGHRNEIIIRRFVGSDRAVFVKRLPGGDEQQILQIPVTRPAQLSAWRLSPKGDRLAYLLLPVGGPASSADRPLHLRTLGQDDDKVIASLAVSSFTSWTSDGRRLVYQAFNPKGFELRQYDVETGESEILLETQHVDGVFSPESQWSIRDCSLATDRTFVVCGVFDTTTQRFAWAGVTYEAVATRLGLR